MAVSDVQSSVEFYCKVIGLKILSEALPSSAMVRLGVQSGSEVLLELQAAPATHRSRQARLGLYHVAFLLPSREDLSSFVQHLMEQGIPFGASDHLYSEALYLTDPGGFTVEVYADRPREMWTFEGQELLSGVFPLDIANLPRVAPDSWNGAHVGTTIGHVHFFVGDLTSATSFYHRGMGLDLMTWRYPGALFTSAGGYHHHVGLNIWAAGSPCRRRRNLVCSSGSLCCPTPKRSEQCRRACNSKGIPCQGLTTLGRSSRTRGGFRCTW